MTSRQRSGDGTLLAAAALLWTVGNGLAFLVVPVVTSESAGASTSTSGVSSEVATTATQQTLLQSEGPSVLIVLLIPVAIALVGALAKGRWRKRLRRSAGVVLLVACLIGSASIGIFYLPAPVLLIAAAIRTPPPPSRHPTPVPP